MATPTFETFKRNNPDCEVHVLCRSIAAPILANNPYVDLIIEHDFPWMSFNYKSNLTQCTEKALVDLLKKENYDIVFEMHGDIRNLRFASQLKSFVIGYGCRGGGFYCNNMKQYNTEIKTIYQNLELIKDYGTMQFLIPQLWTPVTYGLKLPTDFIVINPTSGKKEKNLTDQEVIDIIETHKNDNIVLTGAQTDKDNNSKFEAYLNVTNLTGKTDLKQLIQVVRRAKKVYCPDTGIMHIANAVGIPCKAFFKTTDEKVWGY